MQFFSLQVAVLNELLTKFFEDALKILENLQESRTLKSCVFLKKHENLRLRLLRSYFFYKQALTSSLEYGYSKQIFEKLLRRSASVVKKDSNMDVLLGNFQRFLEQLFFSPKNQINLFLRTPTDASLEAVVQRCSVKKVFLEVSQSSQENTCASVSFNKVKESIKKRATSKTLTRTLDPDHEKHGP